ncbi:carbon dioxide concentrating mechanism/carboxysome shell protein [Desulfosporosinus orientis DSM 765]|uniref:Carbon dioxide concentrating mechanism/carboxysome shell protein n=1 Tax=Desulfosporosinus orientis (strain ATCC 19365 / DSM 765 / NCIMB 8382 / VKM B-1628 / Singapore I) TaxID=768706 RepID=G7WEH2_DESOD|nr:BMC domain-containing protein [Desulfosporosinus orientis]AET70785.1 carbon dioxide concentrating mechanism/carboxysome shell protein [Desulfosporosinus orientis DSM 765]
MQALGLIETRGLLPAIESADVMFKTAQVDFVEKVYTGGGLVTVAVTGDVASVKAAVEAAAAAVERIGPSSLISQHVIPRPDQGIESLFAPQAGCPEEPAGLPEDSAKASGEKPPAASAEGKEDEATVESSEPKPVMPQVLSKEDMNACVEEFGLNKSVQVLRSLSVTKLRKLAGEYSGLGLAGKALARAKKETLVQKLKDYYEGENERKE